MFRREVCMWARETPSTSIFNQGSVWARCTYWPHTRTDRNPQQSTSRAHMQAADCWEQSTVEDPRPSRTSDAPPPSLSSWQENLSSASQKAQHRNGLWDYSATRELNAGFPHHAQSIDIILLSGGYENAHCLLYSLADLPSSWWKRGVGLRCWNICHDTAPPMSSKQNR
jgi:hypothetical protein